MRRIREKSGKKIEVRNRNEDPETKYDRMMMKKKKISRCLLVSENECFGETYFLHRQG
jgi:hypothetical protein